jgi:tRNA dimethylallyltransferase
MSALPAILLIGPTASGKSAAALELAQRFNAEIVSVDSALVYRDMNIGTAKPTLDEQHQVPHHLIDLISPRERYSVAQFISDCMKSIHDVQARGRLPLLVGGTMMYADALIRGMSEVPPTDEAVRAEVTARRNREGIVALHRALAEVDPITAARLPPTDTQRIERALEVWMTAGVPVSALQGNRKPALADIPHAVIRWMPADRAWLHGRCAVRLQQMFALGLVREVEQLRQRYALSSNMASMRCVGYRQVLDVLNGDADRGDMEDRALFATRQLAKRQLTWMRSMAGDVVTCDKVTAVDEASKIIERALSGTGGCA